MESQHSPPHHTEKTAAPTPAIARGEIGLIDRMALRLKVPYRFRETLDDQEKANRKKMLRRQQERRRFEEEYRRKRRIREMMKMGTIGMILGMSNTQLMQTIVVCIIFIVFFSGATISIFTTSWSENTCHGDPPLAAKPKIQIWNQTYTVNSYAYYKCSDHESAPYSEIYKCNEKLHWELLYANPCECMSHPITPLGTVVFNNISKAIGTEVVYKCNGYDNAAIASILKCSYNRHWLRIDTMFSDSGLCRCTETIKIDSYHPIEPQKDLMVTNPEIGTIQYKTCGKTNKENIFDDSSSLMETYFCDNTEMWVKLQQSRCFCQEKPPLPHQKDMNCSWNEADIANYQVGYVVDCRCTQNEKAYVYQTFRCSQNGDWILEAEPEECIPKYHVMTDKRNYEDSQAFCQNRTGLLMRIRSPEESSILLKIMTRFSDTCSIYFLGAKEDSFFRWRWVNDKYLLPSDTSWAFGQPSGAGTCVVMKRDLENWRTVKCETEHCAVCESRDVTCTDKEVKCFEVHTSKTYFETVNICTGELTNVLTFGGKRDLETWKMKLQEVLEASPSTCQDFYIGLEAQDRVYRYAFGEILGSLLWASEPFPHGDYSKECVGFNKTDNFTLIHRQSCNEFACSICEFNGPDDREMIYHGLYDESESIH